LRRSFSSNAADGDTINLEGDNMDRPTETRSKRWKVKGDPAKWEGDGWRSKPEGDKDIEKIGLWVEDMEEWSEMMHEAVMELRGQQAALREEFRHLSELVESAVKRDLKAASTGGDQ
jgi:hypothetical protein